MGRTGLAAWTAIVLLGVLCVGTLGGSSPVMVPQMFLDALTVAGTWKHFLATVVVGGVVSGLLMVRPTVPRSVCACLVIWAASVAFAYQSAMLTPFGH